MDDSSTIDGDSDDATIRDPSKMYRQKKRKQKKDTHAQTISELRILYVCCPKKEDDAPPTHSGCLPDPIPQAVKQAKTIEYSLWNKRHIFVDSLFEDQNGQFEDLDDVVYFEEIQGQFEMYSYSQLPLLAMRIYKSLDSVDSPKFTNGRKFVKALTYPEDKKKHVKFCAHLQDMVDVIVVEDGVCDFTFLDRKSKSRNQREVVDDFYGELSLLRSSYGVVIYPPIDRARSLLSPIAQHELLHPNLKAEQFDLSFPSKVVSWNNLINGAGELKQIAAENEELVVKTEFSYPGGSIAYLRKQLDERGEVVWDLNPDLPSNLDLKSGRYNKEDILIVERFFPERMAKHLHCIVVQTRAQADKPSLSTIDMFYTRTASDGVVTPFYDSLKPSEEKTVHKICRRVVMDLSEHRMFKQTAHMPLRIDLFKSNHPDKWIVTGIGLIPMVSLGKNLFGQPDAVDTIASSIGKYIAMNWPSAFQF